MCVCVCLCACGCRCNVILKIVVRLLQSPADSAPKNIPRKKRTYFQETNKQKQNKKRWGGGREVTSICTGTVSMSKVNDFDLVIVDKY